MASTHQAHLRRGRSRDLAAAERSFRRIGRLCSALAVPFIRIDAGPRDQLDHSGPVIWAPNHRSLFDTFLGLIVLFRIGRTAAFFVTERYFARPIVGWLLLRAGAIPVDPDRPRDLFTEGARRIDAGINLVIMAEGRLVPAAERDGGIGSLQPGVAVLAKRLGVPVQPVALIGADDLWPPGRRAPVVPLMRRRTMTARFGEPLSAEGRSREVLDRLQRDLSMLVQRTEARHRERASTARELFGKPAAIASSSHHRR